MLPLVTVSFKNTIVPLRKHINVTLSFWQCQFSKGMNMRRTSTNFIIVDLISLNIHKILSMKYKRKFSYFSAEIYDTGSVVIKGSQETGGSINCGTWQLVDGIDLEWISLFGSLAGRSIFDVPEWHLSLLVMESGCQDLIITTPSESKSLWTCWSIKFLENFR